MFRVPGSSFVFAVPAFAVPAFAVPAFAVHLFLVQVFHARAALSGQTQGSDWPQFRGPKRDGVVTSFAEPKVWPDQRRAPA